MKILSIHFKNINSLQGENQINFSQPPIADSGVFAITGANGSGKSSILDAITLGLYGETFRFDRPASYVMTKNTADCFATVEFLVNGESYQSRWQVQRQDGNPKAEVQSPQMQLLRLSDGELLAETVQQVCQQMIELTGMNFRNFTRSILLAQGDFAAFLNALDSERMDILEKIVGTDIYAEYQKNITDKAELAEKSLNDWTQQLATINVLKPEQLAACQDDLADFKDQYEQLKAQRKKLLDQQATVNTEGELKQQLLTLHKQQQLASAALDKVEAQLEQLAKTKDVLLFQDDVIAINQQQQVVADYKTALNDLTVELAQLKKSLGNQALPSELGEQSITEQKAIIDEQRSKVNLSRSNQQSEMAFWQSLATQIKEKKATHETVSVWLETHANDQILLENFPDFGQLRRVRAERIELTEKQKLLTKHHKKSSVGLKNNQSDLEQANNKKNDLEQQLQKQQAAFKELIKDNTAETLNALRQEQEERVNSFQQLYDWALAYKKLTPNTFKWFGLSKKQQEQPLDADQLTGELEELTATLKREENIKRVLEQSRIFAALVKKLTADRHHLIDGKPCPLCGGLSHPFSQGLPVVNESIKAVADQQLKIRNLTAAIEQKKKQIELAKKQAHRNQAIAQRLQQLQSQWLGLCHRLNSVSADLDINNLSAMQALLTTETEQLKEINALIEQCRSKQKQINKLKNSLEKNTALIAQLQERVGTLDTNFAGHSQEYQENQAVLNQCQQQEQQLTAQITEQLLLLGEKFPDKNKEDALFNQLNTRRQDYQTYQIRQKTGIEELALLESKQQQCQQEIDHYNELIERYDQQLQKSEIIGLQLAIIEKQKLIAEKEQLLIQQQQQSELIQQVFEEKLHNSPFKDKSELQQLLELHAQQPKMVAEQAQLIEKLATIDGELTKVNALLEQQPSESLPTLEQITQQLKTTAEQIDIAHLEMQRLEKILAEQQGLQQRYTEISKQLQQQQVITDACLADVAKLKAESGMAFRRRVQIEIIGKLLSQTNALLEKLSGRYYLRHQASEQGMALEIEDTYQANERRLPKTLSGGETFVISLALALGLSELANNGKAVDSLFIDEGFGNLDSETLYTVIATLENLKTYGKTVGVISHVEAVKKRFKTQLQVVKKSNGFGQLRKVS